MLSHWPKTTDPIALSADEVHVWAVPIGSTGTRWNEHLAILSPAERQRAEQFRLDAPRRRFVIARAALRTLLGNELAVPPETVTLAAAANGKPRLDSAQHLSDLRFNVAHSGDLAVVAITIGCEVGVDVERLRRVDRAEQIAKRYFHPAETESILAAAPTQRDAAFLRCWTGKEAVLKAVGSGITGSLAALRVPLNENGGGWVDLPAAADDKPSRCWLHGLAPSREYVAAVACLGAERRVRCFMFSI